MTLLASFTPWSHQPTLLAGWSYVRRRRSTRIAELAGGS